MKKLFILLCSVILSIPIFAQEQYICVIAADTFNTTSYAANDGKHNIVGSDGQTYVFITSYIMKSGQYNSIQSKKDAGSYIGFPTNFIVDSIVFNLGTSKYLNFSVKANETNKDGIKVNDSIYYVIPGSYDSLKVVNETKYTAYARYIEVYYHPNKITTAIQNAEETVKIIKTIENNQVVIIRDGIRYTVTGTKIR